MTSIFKQASPDHKSRMLTTDLGLVLDADTQQILLYSDELEQGDIEIGVEVRALYLR